MKADGKKCSHTGFWIALTLLVLALAGSVLLNLGLAAGLAARGMAPRTPARRGGEDEFPALREIHSRGAGPVKAARIQVGGVIVRQSGGGLFSPITDLTQSILDQIRVAKQDDAVQALLIEVDSPGGAITPVDEIHRALTAFRESRPDRRVVVYVRDMAASGGYYIAVAGDRIIAEPTALVGSISVILQTLNWHELSERIGVRDTTIKSGRNKDLLNPFREVDAEQVALLQDVVDHLHERFAGHVRQGRGLSAEALGSLADGRILTSAEALEHRLIDRIGSHADALDLVHELLETDRVKFVRYERTQRFSDWLARLRTPIQWDVLSPIRPPRFAYLWQP